MHMHEDTEEVRRFRSLPSRQQNRLIRVYPRVLASSLFSYSSGEDCEKILKKQFESTPEMMSLRNQAGNNPISNSLQEQQAERSEFLVDLASKKNAKALTHRTNDLASLPMLASMLGAGSADLMAKLMNSDPTQLHRQYDRNGRNVIHHCVMQDSPASLRVLLSIIGDHLRSERVQMNQVRAAFHMNDDKGNTPMHLAASADRSDMLTLMRDFSDEHEVSINFDERQHRGDRRTPLMIAVKKEAKQVCRFLLVEGLADADETDRNDKTAMELTDDEAFRKELEVWSSRSNDEMKVEAAGAAAATKMPNDATTGNCDSGIGTDGSLCSAFPNQVRVSESDQQQALTVEETERICERMQQSGRREAFMKKFSEVWRDQALTAEMTDDPIRTGLGFVVSDPRNRTKILEILRAIGDCDLLNW